jgi:hypothetical protein
VCVCVCVYVCLGVCCVVLLLFRAIARVSCTYAHVGGDLQAYRMICQCWGCPRHALPLLSFANLPSPLQLRHHKQTEHGEALSMGKFIHDTTCLAFSAALDETPQTRLS